ncbi:MAG: DUF2459 domain-containing protein [Balneolaceae bacterium]|nr:DUF2459 domain-containing protein [Balneolaceae bacterium]
MKKTKPYPVINKKAAGFTTLPLIFLMCLTGCLGPVKDLYPDDDELRPIPVYIISHGWHVGIAIEKEQIEPFLPKHERMPQAELLKFGWGDNRYYTDSEAGFGLMMRAALLPTRSVIHVVGIDMAVENYFSRSSIVKVQITVDGAEKLAEFISDRFRLDDEGMPRFASEGLYRNSTFFEARGLYFVPKTSNTWTARALRKTGYPITPFYAITSGNVIQQARKDGELLQ